METGRLGGEQQAAARAYVGTLERFVHAHRDLLTDAEVRALSSGASRFRAAYYGTGAQAVAAAKTAPDAKDEAAAASSRERALRASLRLAEEARAAVAEDLDESRREAASLRRRVGELEAEAERLRSDAEMAAATSMEGRMSSAQLASCRSLQAAAAELEAVVSAVTDLAAAGEHAGRAASSLQDCVEAAAAAKEALASV